MSSIYIERARANFFFIICVLGGRKEQKESKVQNGEKTKEVERIFVFSVFIKWA